MEKLCRGTFPRLKDKVGNDKKRCDNRASVIQPTILLCKAKNQYLLTRKVSRYCFLALHGGWSHRLSYQLM